MNELSLFSGAGMKKTCSCLVCGIEFSSYNPTPTYCSLACKGAAQRADVDDAEVARLYLSGLTQDEVAEKICTTRKVVENSMLRTKTPRRIAAKRNQWGNNNHMWKGDGATKGPFHRRLYRRYGKANHCEVCGASAPDGNYDWANLSGNYHDEKDYKQMCRSCHWKYDDKHLNFAGGKK